MTNDNNPAAPGLPGPGSTLDQLICKKLGYEWIERPGAFGLVGRWIDPTTGNDVYFHDWSPEPAYSTDMNAAWMLVDFVKERYFKTIFSVSYNPAYKKRWLASFEIVKDTSIKEYRAEQDTAPHAICLAFLALPDEVVRGE